MRKLLTLFFTLYASVSVAQVSGPISSKPAFTALSETLANTAQQARNSPLLRQEPTVDRIQLGKLLPQASTNAPTSRSALAAALPSPLITPLITPLAAPLVITAPLPYLQTATFQNLNIVPGANFEGLGRGTPGYSVSGAPSNSTIGVSPTQVVQWVNSQIAVYSKTGNPLLASPGFINGNVIWQSLDPTSLCRTTNRGNPMVQYDRISQRWVLTQYAFSAGGASSSQCIAVSQTNDATGAYYLYEYSYGNEVPFDSKVGIWTDGYYISSDIFVNNTTYIGARACAYDKAAMISGAATAASVCFKIPNLTGTSRFGLLPGDLDGTVLPPAGAPNPQMTWNWVFKTNAPYALQLSKFKPDFVTPSASTFDDGLGGTSLSSVDFQLDASTVAACNDQASRCVPQLGTTQVLDTVARVQNFRLVYRNFGTHDALLLTQSVDPSTAPVAAIRWFEIRNPNTASPVVYQNSTFAPDAESRWVSSAAFDKRGNIAMGYTASSATINPGIRLTGRLRNDPKNLMRTEIVVQAGTGSQTPTLGRWGNHTTMQIDPVDDCTFWYTSQYLVTTGSFNWHTRIASFKFPNCQ